MGTTRYATALALGTALLASAAMSAQAANLKLLTSWNKDNWPTYAGLEEYVKNVKAIGAGKVNIAISGKEVVPPFEQLQPVSAGVFDMLYSHGIYHAGGKGLLFAFDAIKPDAAKRRSSGAWDFIDSYYQKHNNLKVVAIVPASNQGYHIFLKRPLTKANDLQGRKIRGTLSYHGVIRMLGASPVVLPGGQIYTALEKGVIDGAAWPAAGMLSMKHYEVAKYKIRPTFGWSNLGVWVNLDKWKKLTKAEQKVLLDAGAKTEREMPAIGDSIQAQEDQALGKLGVKVTQLTPANHERVSAKFATSMWEIAAKCCGDGSETLRQLAKKAGLTN